MTALSHRPYQKFKFKENSSSGFELDAYVKLLYRKDSKISTLASELLFAVNSSNSPALYQNIFAKLCRTFVGVRQSFIGVWKTPPKLTSTPRESLQIRLKIILILEDK